MLKINYYFNDFKFFFIYVSKVNVTLAADSFVVHFGSFPTLVRLNSLKLKIEHIAFFAKCSQKFVLLH